MKLFGLHLGDEWAVLAVPRGRGDRASSFTGYLKKM